MSSACGDGRSGCGPDCISSCWHGQPRCKVGRKHYRVGGVCCMSCYDLCAVCHAGFYVEYLSSREVPDPEIPGDTMIEYLCHCCATAAGVPWSDPTPQPFRWWPFGGSGATG